MNNIIKAEPRQVSIYVNVSLDKKLMDTRLGHYGLVFGTIREICKQYGIAYEILPKCIKFTAPKNRLQLFVEKLHFAKVKHSRRPL